MNRLRNTCITIALLGTVFVFGTFANDSVARNSGRRPPGPPPEAYTACEGKSAGDKAEFVSPHGDTVTGTCEESGGRLVLRPDNPPPRGRQNDSTKNE